MGRRITHFTPNFLYSFASILWIIAGINILRIAIDSWDMSRHIIWVEILLILSSLIFFSIIIFPKVVKSNIDYVKSYKQDRLHLLRCMHPKSWIIMIIMISLGVALRVFHLVPMYFIAGFYFGLGVSLIISIWPYFREVIKNKKAI